MPSNIEWITGPVHTGKTTRLAARIAENPSHYCGLLAPVNENGKRYLKDIVSGERRMLDCAPDSKDAVAVGPYFFCETVFAWGRTLLLQHHEKYPNRTLVIDEIGKLELRGEGLAKACWDIIELRESIALSTLLIVRDSLVDEVKRRLED